MSKYTKEEQEFLDKAAIAYMQCKAAFHPYIDDDIISCAYNVADKLLTERKKLFGDE